MFNWFKSKIELKNEKFIMSSFHNKNGVKVGSEIVVPQNFECLVFHNGKHYNTLSSGKYKVDKKNFPQLIEQQQKLKSSIKYVKCVCHFINISPQKIEIKFKKQHFFVEFEISNSLNFASLLLLYSYKVDNDYTFTTLHEVFNELLLYHKGDYKQIQSNALINLGLTINSFLPTNHKVSIFSVANTQDKNVSQPQDDVNNLNTNQANAISPSYTTSKVENITQATPHPNQTQIAPQGNQLSQNGETCKTASMPNNSNQQSNQANLQTGLTNTQSNVSSQPVFPTCPMCKNVSKFNTTYCLKCGYKLQ